MFRAIILSSFLTWFFYSSSSLAQEVKILSQSNSSHHNDKSDVLEYVSDSLAVDPIATLELTSKDKPYLLDMYEKIKEHTKKLGGNAFRLKEAEDKKLIIDLFALTEDELEINANYKNKNTFYVFAGEDMGRKEYNGFEVNGAMKSIRTGHYYFHTLEEGEHIKLKKGSISGTTVWVKWRYNQLPSYLTIEGFYKEPVVRRTTISQTDRNAKIRSIDSALGELLIHVLKPQADATGK